MRSHPVKDVAMKTLILAATLALAAAPALAAEHVVRMLNSGGNGERMVFEPSFVQAKSGDTVVFQPADNGHASASVIVPSGADTWDAGLNEETRVTLTQPGVYLFKSRPHFALGMIGMIVVDSPAANRESIDGFKPRGSLMRARFEALKGQL